MSGFLFGEIVATQIASLFSLLSLRDDMTPALERSKRGLADVGGMIDQVGGGLTRLGGAMTAVGAPAAAGFGVAVVAARDFDEAMTNTAAVLGMSRDETAALSAQLLAVGRNTRAGPQAVAEAFYDIAGGVQDASTHMAILNAAIATSEAGNSDLTATTSGLISVMNAYGFEADRAAWVSDVLTRTVGMGVGSMDQFVGALGPASGLAYDVGISFDELAASTAFLTSTGGSASESVTQLTAIMTAFLKPNQAMTEALAAMGYESGTAALQNLGLAGSVQALSGALGGSTDQMAQALGSTEALGGAVGLLSDRAGEFTSSFREGIDGVTESARGIQMESAAAQLDLLTAQASALAIEVGTALLPSLLQIVEDVRPVIDSVIEWVGENPELVAQIGMITGGLVILGPIIAGVGMVLSGVGTIITTVTGGLALAKAGVAALSGTMMGAVAGILAVGAAIAGVINQINEFNRLVGESAAGAGQQLGGAVAGGLTRQHIEDEVFRQSQQQFGDLGARLVFGSGLLNMQGHIDTTYNTARAAAGQSYSSGGYTGDGPVNEVAGMVHRGEYVVPQGGALVMQGSSRPEMNFAAGSIVIHANSYEEGRAVGRGLREELDEWLRAKG